MRAVVITGVSTGIGCGAAKEFARHGYRIFRSVCNEEHAERFGAELGANFTPLLFGVTDREAVLAAAEQVGEALERVMNFCVGGSSIGACPTESLTRATFPTKNGPLWLRTWH